MNKTVRLPDGCLVPAIGQGTWHMGENPSKRREETDALRYGVELGLSLIDTAEMYADGVSEEIAGDAIKGIRDGVFLVSKVYPHNAGLKNIRVSCENSLRRLKTDRLDLYLLHWRGSVPLQETVEGMERLVAQGKILRWGVSNFDTPDMEELILRGGGSCSANQVLYHLGSRGIEYDLTGFLEKRGIPVMAYCPIAQGGRLRRGIQNDKTLCEIAAAHGADPMQAMLAWCVRSGRVIAIPKASQRAHVLKNAEAANIGLTEEELGRLDAAFPKPSRKVPLDMR